MTHPASSRLRGGQDRQETCCGGQAPRRRTGSLHNRVFRLPSQFRPSFSLFFTSGAIYSRAKVWSPRLAWPATWEPC